MTSAREELERNFAVFEHETPEGDMPAVGLDHVLLIIAEREDRILAAIEAVRQYPVKDWDRESAAEGMKAAVLAAVRAAMGRDE